MNRILLFLTLEIALFIAGCTTIPPNDTVFQTSTIDALLAGVYDGDMSCQQLLTHGNFGIGTFDQLDGEMVILDRKLYQIKSDGKVYRPNLAIKTPFATVCEFSGDKIFVVPGGTNYKALEHLIDRHAPNQNLFYAIKIKGTFSHLKTRSVPRQKRPYPSLKKVTKHQPEFKMKNISGTIVGFRCPPYVKGINVPGYHLHFISDDRTQGGHILSFEIISAKCEIDLLNNYLLVLPMNVKDFAETDLSKDRSKALKAVEK